MTPDFSWREKGAAGAVMTALLSQGEARFVGGSVRDSLMGLSPGLPGRTDIDIATTLLPQETIACLTAHNITAIPTGMDHGTITAIVAHEPVEVTTLRADVSTDGRRATVAFTKDWAQDAARRDFTINALYLTAQGEVVDLVGGLKDLKARRVRFIGQPEHRIREDFLRILRFIRFSARFSSSESPMFDREGWKACTKLREGIATLSKERLWQETAKTFAQPGAPAAYQEASDAEVLSQMVPEKANPELFGHVHHLADGDVSPALGLACLWPTAPSPQFKKAFKPAQNVLDGVKASRKASAALALGDDQRKVLYEFGRDAAVSGALFQAGLHGAAILPEAHSLLPTLPMPQFRLRGADFVVLGVPKGPMVGKAVKMAERRWMEADFPEDADTMDRISREVTAALLA